MQSAKNSRSRRAGEGLAREAEGFCVGDGEVGEDLEEEFGGEGEEGHFFLCFRIFFFPFFLFGLRREWGLWLYTLGR